MTRSGPDQAFAGARRSLAVRSGRNRFGAPVVAVVLLAASVIVLALIGFWPTHIDASIRGTLLADVERAVPWLTYRRMEFGANVLAYIPLTYLATLSLWRLRALVVPLAIAASVSVETWQHFQDGRTSSLLDVAANSIGAVIGFVLALGLRRLTRPRRTGR